MWFKNELYKYKMAARANTEILLINTSKNEETANHNVYLQAVITSIPIYTSNLKSSETHSWF